jgi:hypothetical protein
MFRNRQILILNNRIAAERWPDEGKTRTERTENPAGKPLGLQYLFSGGDCFAKEPVLLLPQWDDADGAKKATFCCFVGETAHRAEAKIDCARSELSGFQMRAIAQDYRPVQGWSGF